MREKNIEKLDYWWDYFTEAKKNWDFCTRDISLEAGGIMATNKKIDRLLGYDFDNKDHLKIPGVGAFWGSLDEQIDQKLYDLLIVDSKALSSLSEVNEDLQKLFESIKPNGTLAFYDDFMEDFGINYNYKEFRKDNSYRLKSIISSDNTIIYPDGSADLNVFTCYIFSKSNCKETFINLNFATNTEMSKIHLLSNLDNIYNDRDSGYWYSNNLTKSNGLENWQKSDLYNHFIGFNPDEGNEINEWYNIEFYWNKDKKDKIYKKYNEVNPMSHSFQNHIKTEKTIDVIVAEIISTQESNWEKTGPLIIDSPKTIPYEIFSTQYLGELILDNYIKVNYQRETIIRHFQKYCSNEDEFEIALKYFEFDKLNPGKIVINSNPIPKQNTQIVFSQIGTDLKQESNELTDFTIDFLEKISSDGKIIYQLNDRKILEDDEFEQYRKDFFRYLESIIDFGIKENNDDPAAFIILGKQESDFIKLIDDRSFKNFNMKRLKLQFDDKSFDIRKTDLKKFEKHWKIKTSFMDNIKSFINRIDEEDGEEKESVKKIESTPTVNVNVNYGNEEILDKIDERADKTDENVNKKHKLSNQHITKEHQLSKQHVTEEHQRTRDLINEMVSDVKSIKKMNTDIDEKLKQIVETVDSYADEIGNDIEKYTTKVKEWFKNYELSEEYSRTVIPTSEYLYERLDGFKGGTDFSSFIAYSSQALEYEVFKKIFIEFHKHIDEKFSNEEKRELTSYDISSIKNKTIIGNIEYVSGYFHRLIKNPNLEKKYTLGFMAKTMSYLSLDKSQKHGLEYRTLKSLQELDKFIHENMEEIDKEFLDDLNEFSDLRNKAAHPGEMSQVQAKKYWKKFKELVDLFLNKFK